MEMFRDFIKWFQYITIGVLIVCAVNFSLSGTDTIPPMTLWQILLSGFVTTLITMLFYLGKRATYIKFGIHYVVLCGVMIPCGYWFGWLSFNAAEICMMIVSVAVVYLLAFVAYYLIDLKQAEKINQRLKEKYPN